MEAHWIKATVGEHGKLILENLPFEGGQSVEVLVVSTVARHGQNQSLRDSVIEYLAPFEPVADGEWEALR